MKARPENQGCPQQAGAMVQWGVVSGRYEKKRMMMVGWVMYGLLYTFFHTMIKLGWWRWRVEGLENLPARDQGGLLLVMNHINWVDIIAVDTLLPFKYRLSWLGKSELFAHPVARWFFHNMQVVPVQRGKRDTTALDTAAEMLRQGAAMLIFPEGHRSRTGILQPGRGGAVRIAMRSGVPMVPMAILGTQHGMRGTLLRKEVLLRIGQPSTIPPTPNGKIPPDMMATLTEEMMQHIAALLPAEYRGPYQVEQVTPLADMRYNEED
jgi:1-acyl-sn-glycerol-3-phosphate acyltransferase